MAAQSRGKCTKVASLTISQGNMTGSVAYAMMEFVAVFWFSIRAGPLAIRLCGR
jgi:hypothetical protein